MKDTQYSQDMFIQSNSKKKKSHSNFTKKLLFTLSSIALFTLITFLSLEAIKLNREITKLSAQNNELKSTVHSKNFNTIFAANPKKYTPKTIYFIRHGETDANVSPIPIMRGRIKNGLNADGKRHCEQAGQFLKDEKVTKIYYSEVERAKESAEAIHKYHPDAQLVPEPLIIDISWGDWEGKDFIEIFNDATGYEFFNTPQKLDVPNGDSFFIVLDKMQRFLFKILKSDENDIVVVTHGTNLNLLACYIMDAPFNKLWNMYMSACGVSKVVVHDIDNIKIKYWNANHFLD